ncbi:MAG: peptidoglycan-binding protein [Paracoccaceae bacterium]
MAVYAMNRIIPAFLIGLLALGAAPERVLRLDFSADQAAAQGRAENPGASRNDAGPRWRQNDPKARSRAAKPDAPKRRDEAKAPPRAKQKPPATERRPRAAEQKPRAAKRGDQQRGSARDERPRRPARAGAAGDTREDRAKAVERRRQIAENRQRGGPRADRPGRRPPAVDRPDRRPGARPSAGHRPPRAGRPDRHYSGHHGHRRWRAPLWRDRGWRPHHHRPPYYRRPHPYWGAYSYSPFWGWYFTAPLAAATLVYVVDLPQRAPCETFSINGERLIDCDGVLYRPSQYRDSRVYEIVSDDADFPTGAAAGYGAEYGAEYGAGYYGPTLALTSPRLRGAKVGELQEELAALGYYRGRIDYIFGPATDRALRAFQRDQNIGATGIVDERSAYLLGL